MTSNRSKRTGLSPDKDPTKLRKWAKWVLPRAGGGACGQVKAATRKNMNDDGVSVPSFTNTPISPLVFCIEPMPQNIKLLQGAVNATSLSPSSFVVEQYITA